MQHLRILNKKQVKSILSMIKSQWDAEPGLDYVFLSNKEGKVYIINKEFADLDTDKIRINSLGLYIGESGAGEMRLSIEGSQLIGPYAKKNIIELDDNEAREWFKGLDLHKKTDAEGYAIIKHNSDFIGCGRVKEGKIWNFVPKIRRINAS